MGMSDADAKVVQEFQKLYNQFLEDGKIADWGPTSIKEMRTLKPDGSIQVSVYISFGICD